MFPSGIWHYISERQINYGTYQQESFPETKSVLGLWLVIALYNLHIPRSDGGFLVKVQYLHSLPTVCWAIHLSLHCLKPPLSNLWGGSSKSSPSNTVFFKVHSPRFVLVLDHPWIWPTFFGLLYFGKQFFLIYIVIFILCYGVIHKPCR